MGKNSNKYFTVNMNTNEPSDTNNNNPVKESITVKSNLKESPVRHINFKQVNTADYTPQKTTVRRIEDPRKLFEDPKEKMRPKDMKKVIVPAIGLIIFCIINHIFLIPLVIDTLVTHVLHGELNIALNLGNMQNEQLVALAGVIAILSYCIFSISLLAFSIYNIYKRVYVKKDIEEIALKIVLYAFLISFCIVMIDCFIPINLSELTVKITTFGMHSIVKYVKK